MAMDPVEPSLCGCKHYHKPILQCTWKLANSPSLPPLLDSEGKESTPPPLQMFPWMPELLMNKIPAGAFCSCSWVQIRRGGGEREVPRGGGAQGVFDPLSHTPPWVKEGETCLSMPHTHHGNSLKASNTHTLPWSWSAEWAPVLCSLAVFLSCLFGLH